MTRIRRLLTSTEAGFTLAEMLVSIIVFGMVGAIVTTASVSGLQHQTKLQNRNDALALARNALQSIDRDIRSAYPLYAASPTQIVFDEAQTTVTRHMTYTVSNGQLLVDETDTLAGVQQPRLPTRVLLSNLVHTDSAPVFTFTPKAGYTAPANSGVIASTCVWGAVYDARCIGKITVTFAIQVPRQTAPITLSDNGSTLRNAT